MSSQKILIGVESPSRPELFANTLPPLGALGLVSFLEDNGFEVAFGDANERPVAWTDLAHDPMIAGFSVHIANVERSLEAAGSLKAAHQETMVVFGGPLPSSAPEPFALRPEVDFVVAGEGEKAFLDLARGRNPKEIPGLVFAQNGKPIRTSEQTEEITDLDSLPFPALDRVDLKKYHVPIRLRSPISNIVTSRGCPYRCIFCFHAHGGGWRARSAENVVDEIEWQVNSLGAREICINDDNFSMDIDRAKVICEGIIRRGIRVALQFQNGVRVDRVDRELVGLLKRAGVWMMGVAPETGDPESMEKIEKRLDRGKIEQVVNWCREQGIVSYAYFMAGFPWEGKSHIHNTIDYMNKLDTDIIQISRVYPFPGTKLYEMTAPEQRPDPLKDQGIFYGGGFFQYPGMTEKELQTLIRVAHRKFYFNPRRMLRLLRILPLPRLLSLAWYSLTTGNV